MGEKVDINIGSSPRLRGTLFTETNDEEEPRIIPAPAGNTGNTRAVLPSDPDHPRACGEHNVPSLIEPIVAGSSPRLRGTRQTNRRKTTPRRIIPAPAGNTLHRGPVGRRPADHPRACGEHRSLGRPTAVSPGSSPRLRGTRIPGGLSNGKRRIIPAPAGNTGEVAPRFSGRTDHPRACGEHAPRPRPAPPQGGSSPRLRGTRRPARQVFFLYRIIPAPAGNTAFKAASSKESPDHPRACGEHH